MNKPLYLFVGKSASGKTTVANMLEGIGKYKSVQSYTTREPRFDGETGHIFVSNEQFNELKDIVAYNVYNNNQYGATKEQVDNSDIYVIDTPGVEMLLEKYETERKIVVLYFDASIRTRIDRMINRHDCDASIVSRIYNDEEFDWQHELSKIVWNYKNNEGKNVEMHVINANQNIDDVLMQVTNYFNNEMDGELDGNCM